MPRLGELLRKRRLEAGLTQEMLAERAGLGVRSIQALERGQSRPHRETVERLAVALGLAGDQRAELESLSQPAPRLSRHVPPPSGGELAARQGVHLLPGEAATHDLVQGVFGPRSTRGSAHHSTLSNLPATLTSFVGREREMSEVRHLLQGMRLLTLTGTGGCGKTRLAYQVAAELLDEYADGVWTAELASLSDPALVRQAVASALGLREEAGSSILGTLVDYLQPKRLLLVLDNCEHLLDASARLADTLLHACPDLRILTTSREALGLYGEAIYRVPSLSTLDPHQQVSSERLVGQVGSYESVRLFCERARLVRPDFALTERNASAVAQICWRLDGIPLAIELAAARLGGLSLEGIAGRLDDRFHLLTGGSRTALRRQQTLRAAIDWSYDLLSPSERCLFRRLAVFSGGWCLEAAEKVCSGRSDEATIERGEILDLLLRLVGRSLVVAEVEVGRERYRFLETIRQYAREKLLESGEISQTRDLHRDWVLSLIGDDAHMHEAGRTRQLFDRLEFEHDNLRAALSWCLETDPALGLRFAGGSQRAGVYHFWINRGYPSEGRYWLRELLARAPEHAVDRAAVLEACAWLASDQGDLAEAESLAEEALKLARETKVARSTIWPLIISAEVASLRGSFRRARMHLEEALALARGLDDPALVAGALHWLVGVVAQEGDYRRARECAEEELETFRVLGYQNWVVAASVGIAMVDQAEGNFARARQPLEEAVRTFREVGERSALAGSLAGLGYRVGCDGDYERGVSLLREGLVALQSMGHRLRLGRCLYLLGIVEEGQGSHLRAVRLIGAAMKLIGESHPEASASEVSNREASLARSREALGEEAFAEARAEGQAMTLEQAVEYALGDG